MEEVHQPSGLDPAAAGGKGASTRWVGWRAMAVAVPDLDLISSILFLLKLVSCPWSLVLFYPNLVKFIFSPSRGFVSILVGNLDPFLFMYVKGKLDRDSFLFMV